MNNDVALVEAFYATWRRQRYERALKHYMTSLVVLLPVVVACLASYAMGWEMAGTVLGRVAMVGVLVMLLLGVRVFYLKRQN